MNNKIKTHNYIISSDDILGIALLRDSDNNIYGIRILFKYGSSLRICNKEDAMEIFKIFDAYE